MPLWLAISMIVITSVNGIVIGACATFAATLYILNNPKGSRQRKKSAANYE